MPITPSWNNMYAPIAPTRLAAQDSVSWITDGPTLYHYDNNLSLWVSDTKPSSAALTDIAASSDGSVVAVDSAGTYLYASGSYSALYISSNTTTSAANGDMHNQVIVDSIGAVTKSVYGINTALASGPSKVTATGLLNDMWGVSATGTVYKYNATTAAWATITGKTLAQIHASLSSTGTLQIVGVDSLGKGWSYNGTTWSAIPVPNPGDKYASLQAGAGYIWAVLTTGAVYRGYI